MRNQAGEKEETERSESGNGHRGNSCEVEPRREGKEETEAK